MHDRLRHTMLALTCVIVLSTQVQCAGPTDLSPSQKQTAACMASVLKILPNVTNPRLVVSHNPGVHVVLDYEYRHQNGTMDHEDADITRMILRGHKHQRVNLGGLMTPGGSADDADLGMITNTGLWRTQCGLDLEVTVN